MTNSMKAGAAVFAAINLLLTAASAQEFETKFKEGTDAMRRGQFAEAANAFERCTTLEPSFAEGFLNLGLARLELGRYEDAGKSFARAAELKPVLHGAHLFLGISRYRINDFTGAVAALRREADIDPSNAAVFMWLGVVQLAENKATDAAADLDKAARLSPKDVDILYHQGRAHMLMSRQIYEQMYQVDPNSWRIHEVLAEAYSQSDRLPDAIKECEDAIRLRPAEPGLHQQLGDIYWKQNRLDMAETEFANELKIDPVNIAGIYKLGVVSLERSKPDVAAKLLKDVLRFYPNSIEGHYQLGRALAQLGDDEGAVAQFSAVVSQPKRSDPDVLKQSYYQLAHGYRKLHKMDEARAAMDNFQRLQKESEAKQQQSIDEKLKRARTDAVEDGSHAAEVSPKDVRP
jgi:tetratricopeptide (TPR) repeat protein